MGAAASTQGLNSPGKKAKKPKKSSKRKDSGASSGKESPQEHPDVKILLLGAGESGKSSVVKQMRIAHLGGYSEDERLEFQPHIYDNMLEAMVLLINLASRNGYPVACKDAEEIVLGCTNVRDFTPKVGAALKALWADDGIQMAFSRRAEVQLIESAAYFFDACDRISAADYVPSANDIVYVRARTTGITEAKFDLQGLSFALVDVGGQRSERKKWIHCFENVTAVLFLAAVSEYDQVLYEDEEVRRIDESLQLFDEIVNLRWFKNTPIVIFFNKMDLFEEKLRKIPFSKYFPEFKGSDNVDDCKEFLSERYLSYVVSQQVFTFWTTATNPENVQFVFRATAEVLQRELASRLAR